MPTRQFSDEEYRSSFTSESRPLPDGLNALALQRALDTRKFEIDLYWRRAAYFWTFIAATLAGFVAVQVSDAERRTDMSVVLCYLGIVFSFGWLCVNRGSKYWQENWEKHVDMLEDGVTGPLYKVVMSRREPSGLRQRFEHLLTGPTAISVSKVNQLISLFMTSMWVVLLVDVLPPFELERDIDLLYFSLGLACFLACISFVTLGRTYEGGFWHRASIRTTSINNS